MISCSSEQELNDDFDKLGKYEKLNIILKDSLKVNTVYNDIFVITEVDCPKCNYLFSKLSMKYFDEKVLIVVNSYGNKIDISTFKENEFKENIVFDFDDLFINYGIVEKSTFISLKESKIDTLIEIEPISIEDKFDLIERIITEK
ncbi:MAG: hypothetical protein WEA99_13240 [Brumimicrobium sp.]